MLVRFPGRLVGEQELVRMAIGLAAEVPPVVGADCADTHAQGIVDGNDPNHTDEREGAAVERNAHLYCGHTSSSDEGID
jgi:hypothetical protein